MGDRLTIRCRLDGPLVLEIRPQSVQAESIHAEPIRPDPAGGPIELADSSPPTTAFQVVDHEGRPFPLPTHKRAVALCRCGQSRTRPFCDGSHKETGFVARETAEPRPLQKP